MALTLLFLDLETTGLDPDTCQIIECAAVLIGDQFDELVVDTLVSERADRSGGLTEGKWEPGAQAMHEKNGLKAMWESGTCMFLSDVEKTLLKALAPYAARSVILAGNSIHFDRAFIKVNMPELDAALHYRHMDVSVLMTFFEEAAGIKRTLANAHRALVDVQTSLAAYRRFEKAVRGWCETAERT